MTALAECPPIGTEMVIGDYRARVTGYDPGHPNDWFATWTIYRDGKEVGKMFEGPGAGYPGKVRCSMTKLVWSGRLPEGCASPKSEHYGIHFDGSPCANREEALSKFATAANRLIAWRLATEKQT